MSLTPCLDCGRDISSLAPACVHCGRPAPARAAALPAVAACPSCPVCGMDVTHPHARTGGAAWCEQCGTKLIFGTDGALVRVLPRASEPPVHAQPLLLVERKSVGGAALLAFLFGPLGMLYATGRGAAIMFVVTFFAMILTFGLGLFITWPVGVLWATHAASEHNRRLATYAAHTNVFG